MMKLFEPFSSTKSSSQFLTALLCTAAALVCTLLISLLPSAALSQNQPVTSIDGARNFPAKSRLAEVSFGVFPDVTVDGQAAKFSASGRILNESNLIIIPSTVYNKTLRMLVEMDFSGNNLNRAWILNEKEMKLAEERASKK